MSSIAVFLILGGATAFAASKIGSNQLKAGSVTTGKLKREAVAGSKLKKNAVTTTKIHKDAVTGAKVKDGSLTGSDINVSTLGTVPSAASAQPTSFAHVNSAGALDTTNSKSAGTVTKVGTGGLYCFSGLPFSPKGGEATVDFNNSGFEFAQLGIGEDSGKECPSGTQAFVFTVTGSGTPIAAGFFALFYG
jgi:hypothetical protein